MNAGRGAGQRRSSSTRRCPRRPALPVETPWDVEGADILLIHNAGEILAWPENPGAFGVILERRRHLLDDVVARSPGYDAVNYGLWYDDAQFARVALLHARGGEEAQGEEDRRRRVRPRAQGAAWSSPTGCSTGDLDVPARELPDRAARHRRERPARSSIRSRNDFPVTLHDPCNIVRLMGIVEPQRRDPARASARSSARCTRTASTTTAAAAAAGSPS